MPGLEKAVDEDGDVQSRPSLDRCPFVQGVCDLPPFLLVSGLAAIKFQGCLLRDVSVSVPRGIWLLPCLSSLNTFLQSLFCHTASLLHTCGYPQATKKYAMVDIACKKYFTELFEKNNKYTQEAKNSEEEKLKSKST